MILPGGTKMPRRLPPFVECWRDRHRKVRVYFRRGKGKRVPLGGPVGSPEFLADYQAAIADETPSSKPPRSSPDSIAALVESYLRSEAFREGLRETSKAGYRSRLEILRTQ